MSTMVSKRRICTVGAALVAALLAACGQSRENGAPSSAAGTRPAAAGTLAVVNGDFEQTGAAGSVPGWLSMQHAGVPSYEMVAEAAAAYQGHGGFRMTRTHQQFYGTLAQDVALPQPQSGELELSAMLKTQDVGPLGWKLVVIAGGDPIYSNALTGTNDWQRVSVRVKPAAGVTSVRIGVTLLDAGSGYADDVQLKAVAP